MPPDEFGPAVQATPQGGDGIPGTVQAQIAHSHVELRPEMARLTLQGLLETLPGLLRVAVLCFLPAQKEIDGCARLGLVGQFLFLLSRLGLAQPGQVSRALPVPGLCLDSQAVRAVEEPKG